MLSILISESEQKWAKKLKSFLEEKSYLVSEADNGKDCQLRVYKNHYDAVILDLDTRNHSGLEVLKYLRLNHPGLRVLLSVQSKDRLDKLNLDEEGLRKMGVSCILVKPYSLDELNLKLQNQKQHESWKKVTPLKVASERVTVNEDDNSFTRIKVNEFFSGNTTIFDVFIKLSQNQYLKIFELGSSFEKTTLEEYIKEFELEYLYFKTKERRSYINFINHVLLNNSGDEEDKKESLRTVRGLMEKYIEEVYISGLEEQLVEEGKQLCENVYEIISGDLELVDLLEEYEELDPSGFSHQVLVAFFSTVICKNLDWANQRTVELVIFGAIFHDIGKLRHPQIQNKPSSELSEKELELYYQHPKLGAEMLERYPILGEAVRQIVYQHHEYVNGEGFPNGLTGNKIYPLAKIVSLADEFSNILTKRKIKPVEALRVLVEDRKSILRYDPLATKALIKGFIRENQ